jgi:hypothetical protein
MEKTIVMLAMLGASFGLSAQTYQKPDKTNKEKTGITETTYEKTALPDKTAVTIPEKVKEGFSRDYYTKDITPVWTKEGENYKVSFVNESIGSVAVYDKNGKLILTERELRKNEYPAEIDTYLYKNHMALTGLKVWELNGVKVWELNQHNTIKYSVDDNGHTIWFDKNGNRITTGGEHMAIHKQNNGIRKGNKKK